MGLVYRGIHEKIALKARDYIKATALVETGTFRGETAFWAKDKFERVITLELSPTYYKISEELMKDTHNVLLILGDSRDWLGQVCIGRHNDPTVFWLDAHYSGITETNDPHGFVLLDELNIINNNFFGPHIIMVDDYYVINKRELAPHDKIMELLVDKGVNNRDVRVVDDIYFACHKLPEDFDTWKK